MLIFDDIQIGDKIGPEDGGTMEVVFKAKSLKTNPFEIMSDAIIFNNNTTSSLRLIDASKLNNLKWIIKEKASTLPKKQGVCDCDIVAIWRGEKHKCGL